MKRFADFCKGIRKCENKHLHFWFLGKPSKLFDTTKTDQIPTLKLGHDKLTINTSKLIACYSQSNKRSTKKIKLEALSNNTKTSESSLDVEFNTENFETYSNEINS